MAREAPFDGFIVTARSGTPQRIDIPEGTPHHVATAMLDEVMDVETATALSKQRTARAELRPTAEGKPALDQRHAPGLAFLLTAEERAIAEQIERDAAAAELRKRNFPVDAVRDAYETFAFRDQVRAGSWL